MNQAVFVFIIYGVPTGSFSKQNWGIHEQTQKCSSCTASRGGLKQPRKILSYTEKISWQLWEIFAIRKWVSKNRANI